jgi:DNA-binding ferritin-like protein
MDKAAELLIELSDIANCLSGDFHTLHFNITGSDFDTMHKKVLKKYYEEAANDYDSIAEMARRKSWAVPVPNTNASAERIHWANFEGICSRETAIQRTDKILELYIVQMNTVYRFFDKKSECPVSQGIASWLQDRLNYWGAEWGFFNAARL